MPDAVQAHGELLAVGADVGLDYGHHVFQQLRQGDRRGVDPDVPFSILLISSTSLMSPNRWRLERVILFRQSSTLSGSSRWTLAMSVMPTMAFMGVRMSWDMWERKSDLAGWHAPPG